MNSATKKKVTKQERIEMWGVNAKTPKSHIWSKTVPWVGMWHGWDVKFRSPSCMKSKDEIVEETVTGTNGSATGSIYTTTENRWKT